jgi:hypothetical protein
MKHTPDSKAKIGAAIRAAYQRKKAAGLPWKSKPVKRGKRKAGLPVVAQRNEQIAEVIERLHVGGPEQQTQAQMIAEILVAVVDIARRK